ncbi:MAG TPA: hypothetical protein VMA75_03215 [Candidatus Paceibacterota bacterium]|nr:hypothetical protein [Candidatus Paceibacterota bacterium]
MAEEKNGKIVQVGNTTCACGPGCTCGCGHYYAHRIFWWVLGIIVLGIVFCVGVKAGEFRDELRGMFGGYYGRGYPMMQYHGGYGGGTNLVSPAVPENPTGVVTSTPEGPMIPATQ